MTPPDRYHRRVLLSHGELFDIWLADDVSTGEAVAIKASLGGSDAAQRLAAELVARRECVSAGFIPLRADASGTTEPHLVLDYVAHCRFDDLTAPGMPDLARPLALRLLSIATSLQRAGLVHGALDGANVLISRGSEVHVGGLGGILPVTLATSGTDALAIGTLLTRCIETSTTAAADGSLPTRTSDRAVGRDPLLIAVVGALLETDPGSRIGTEEAFALLSGA